MVTLLMKSERLDVFSGMLHQELLFGGRGDEKQSRHAKTRPKHGCKRKLHDWSNKEQVAPTRGC
jgi:hypothetical protein